LHLRLHGLRERVAGGGDVPAEAVHAARADPEAARDSRPPAARGRRVSARVWPKRQAGLFPDNESRGVETVLVVEDEPAVRGLVESMLGLHGYQVIAAENAGDALEVSTSYEGRIDLLLTDVEMPDMSGRELAQRLRAERTEMRLLYMSGHDE